MSDLVVVAGPGFEMRYRGVAEAILSPHGRVVWVDHVDEARLDRCLPTAAAVVATPWLGAAPHLAMPVFDERRFACAPRLRVIAGTFDFRFGWIDLGEATRHRVAVSDTSRTMTPTVAEFGLAMTLNLLRDIPAWIDTVRGGGWKDRAVDGGGFVHGDLAGKHVGLAGYGSINRRYRSFLAPFGCDVATYDPFVDDVVLEGDGVTRAQSLEELALGSEIFVVAIPPTSATMGIVDAAAIDAIPRGALFLLLSRMAVVEQAALWSRVERGELRAAIDVYDPEPPPPDAFFRRAPNVLPTPHLAGNAIYAHERCFSAAASDAASVVAGRPPQYLVAERDARLYEGSLG